MTGLADSQSPVCLMSQADAREQIPDASLVCEKGLRRVLLVDDEDNILAALRRLLRREPYETLTAASAEEAIRIMEATPAQVVISDQRMPGITGVELIHEIRERWPSTLRLILSGYSEVNSIIAAINEGEIYKFISKPWNDEELKLHVRRAIEQYDLQAENERMAREILEQNNQLIALNRLLDQKAEDASTGQTCTQDLLEAIDVGIVAVDPTGLIVGANRQAHRLMQVEEAVMLGMPVRNVLPPDLHDVLQCSPGVSHGHLHFGGKQLQWRVSILASDCASRGLVLSLWEEVS